MGFCVIRLGGEPAEIRRNSIVFNSGPNEDTAVVRSCPTRDTLPIRERSPRGAPALNTMNERQPRHAAGKATVQGADDMILALEI